MLKNILFTNIFLRTRRRRIEGASGRVGSCSGETEVAFQACIETHCIGEKEDGDEDGDDDGDADGVALIMTMSCAVIMMVALVKGVIHIWLEPRGQMNIAGHI